MVQLAVVPPPFHATPAMTERRPVLPPDDPLRRALHEEVHARPPALLEAPERIAHLALRIAPEAQTSEDAALVALAVLHGLPAPDPRKAYAWLDCGAFRVKWERHTEFSGWTFYCRVAPDTAPSASALDVVPAEWLSTLPGPTLVAMEIALDRVPPESAAAAIAASGDTMVVDRGSARAWPPC